MSHPSGPSSVKATLNYLLHTERRPYSYTFTPPPGVPQRYSETDAVSGVEIRNGRGEDFSLDRQGFEIIASPTTVTDFYDKDEVKSVYYPETEALLKKALGAEEIIIFDHTVRSMPRFLAGEKGMRDPQRRVHNDFTAASGPRRIRDHLAPEEAEIWLNGHYVEVNVWRPITGPLEDAPLALCDARTIAAEDFIICDLIYPDKVGEIYYFSYNPAHRWYYFPKMRTDEAVLIKCFDSDEAAGTRFTAHTAFDDPTMPSNARPRESIEVRALALLSR